MRLKIGVFREKFMKNMVLRQIWVFFAVIVLAGCATTQNTNSDGNRNFEKQSFSERINAWFIGINEEFKEWRTGNNKLVSNKNGYNRTEPLRERIRKRKQPDWVNNPDAWINNQNDLSTMEYFYGFSYANQNEIINSGVDRTIHTASDKAYNNAYLQLARVIDEKRYEAEFTDDRSEARDTIIKGQKKRTQVVGKERVESRSHVIIAGYFPYKINVPVEYFYEEYEIRVGLNKSLSYFNYYLIIAVSKDSIEKAKEIKVAEKKLEDMIKEQKDEFKRLSRDHEEIIRNLVSLGLSIFSEEEKLVQENKYKEEYNKLIDIYNKLSRLDLLENIAEENTGLSYISLLKQTSKDLDDFGFSSFLKTFKNRFEIMQKEMLKKDGAIDELRNSNASLMNQLAKTQNGNSQTPDAKDTQANSDNGRRQEYRIQSQTILMSFPPRPNETTVSTVGVFAANEMVSNSDFISFATMNGMNAYSRSDHGLETPVTSVTWNEAARYCNWLSKLYGYNPCYSESKGQITGYDKTKNGYRLPERAEIIAMIETRREVFEADIINLGIWSSDQSPTGHYVYILDTESGSVNDRLIPQSLKNTEYDLKIGFRVVRNAK